MPFGQRVKAASTAEPHLHLLQHMHLQLRDGETICEYYLRIFFWIIAPASRALTTCLGISSSLAMIPLPSMARGEMRKVAPLNITSGRSTSRSWVMANLMLLPYRALVTSSIGVSALAAWESGY